MGEDHARLKDFKNKAFSTLRVFAQNESYFDIPANVFVAGVFLVILIIITTYFLAGIAFGALYYWGMHRIHKHDPKAIELWGNALRRSLLSKSFRWSAGVSKSTRLIIIK